MFWENWCRLCGNENGNNIDLILQKTDETFQITEAIKNLLSIEIRNYDETPTKICLFCHEHVNTLMIFAAKTNNVQQMFKECIELGILQNKSLENINFFRRKYGLSTIENDNDVNDAMVEISVDPIKIVNLKIEENNDNNLDSIENVDLGEYIKEEQNLKEELQENDDESNKKYLCNICSKKFIRRSNLTTHLKSKHSIEKKLPICEICGKTCTTLQKLTFHKRSHLPLEERLTYQCSYCEQKLSTEHTLKEHIRYKHTKEKRFICEQCGKKFTTKQELKIHKYVHEADDELHCKICSKVFKNIHRVKIHMKVHRDKVFPCTICGLQLKTQKTLKDHLVVHSNQKPFKCNFCGAVFRRDKNLKAHMIIHTGLKPYECGFCSQSYANRSNCKKHQKHSHPEQFAAMEASGIQHYSKNVPTLSQLHSMLEAMKSNNTGENQERNINDCNN